ncbi:hypothetical protein MPNT_270020 [Candidatus Methylacidithermus pantelleriae]|uniref:Uncharacterized protein n=1 Tax=Candidatus Methylacidithermus pantelleriae TaxID=2744239 RepID=A0A8J2BL58_9BACT|nr:hypothetical protein MPNT_270020 [Candidatus Methylacidithermus pantelleriae]
MCEATERIFLGVDAVEEAWDTLLSYPLRPALFAFHPAQAGLIPGLALLLDGLFPFGNSKRPTFLLPQNKREPPF